jgi:hypothetical protein
MSWGWSYEFDTDIGTVRYSTATEEWTVNGKVEGRMSSKLADILTDMLDTEGGATVIGFEVPTPSPSNPTERSDG